MIRNVGLSSGLNLYRALIQFGLNIVLAHFLAPSEFGEVALILPVTLLILLIGDFGLSAAIIRGSATAREAGAASAICTVYGIGFSGIVILLYAVGLFRSWPGQTAELLVAFGIVAMLAMLAIVPRAMLERRLAYGRITIVETLANTGGFIVAVVAAGMGAGVWAFPAYHLTMQVGRGLYFWLATREDIEFNTQWRSVMPLIAFGGWVVAFNLVNYFARNLDRYIIGGLLGTAPLGLYALAYQVMLVPLMAFTWPASGVLLSTLSRLRVDPPIMRRSFLAILGLGAAITFPMMAFVALRGGLLFSVLLPTRWHDVAPVIGRMAIAGGLQSSTAFVGALFLVYGRVRTQFWVGVAATALVLVAVGTAAAAERSLIAVANSYVAVTLVLSFGYFWAMARMLGTGVGTVLAALAPAVVLVVACSVVTLLVERMMPTDMSALVQIAVDVAAYGLTGVALLALRRASLLEALGTLRSAGMRAAV